MRLNAGAETVAYTATPRSLVVEQDVTSEAPPGGQRFNCMVSERGGCESDRAYGCGTGVGDGRSKMKNGCGDTLGVADCDRVLAVTPGMSATLIVGRDAKLTADAGTPETAAAAIVNAPNSDRSVWATALENAESAETSDGRNV